MQLGLLKIFRQVLRRECDLLRVFRAFTPRRGRTGSHRAALVVGLRSGGLRRQVEMAKVTHWGTPRCAKRTPSLNFSVCGTFPERCRRALYAAQVQPHTSRRLKSIVYEMAQGAVKKSKPAAAPRKCVQPAQQTCFFC